MMDTIEIEKTIAADLDHEHEVLPQQPVDIENPPALNDDTNNPDNLQKILLSKEQLTDIKNDLGAMIDVMAHNPSWFSRAADFWGKVPLWQKIIGGIVLIVPTLVVAFFTHMALFLAVSIFSLVAYVTSSLMLDNHHSSIASTTENLKEGINSLADVLGIIIQALGTLHQELARSIEDFKQENKKLAGTITELGAQVEDLTSETTRLGVTVQSVEATNMQLETNAATLNNSIELHAQLIEKVKAQLTQAQTDYAHCQRELEIKIEELDRVKTEMSLELSKTKEVIKTLHAAVNSLSNSAISDEENRDAFKARLEEYLKNGEATFAEFSGRLQELESKLKLVTDELKLVTEALNDKNQKYDELLKRNEELMGRMERVLKQLNSSPAAMSSNASALTTMGVFANTTMVAEQQYATDFRPH